MTAPVPFHLLVLGPFDRNHIDITMTTERRPPHPVVDDLIDHAWEARLAQAAARGQRLFPGPMCALRTWSVADGRLQLRFGLTDYREFVGTNVANPDVGERFGEEQLANGTGVCSVLETSDGRLILQRRSDTVFEHPGMLHFCGGALDPIHQAGRPVADPFAVMQREFDEELGLRSDALGEMRLLGLARDGATLKPDVMLHTRTALTAADVLSIEGEEHEALVDVPVAPSALTAWMTEHWNDITPAGLACLIAYAAITFNAELASVWMT